MYLTKTEYVSITGKELSPEDAAAFNMLECSMRAIIDALTYRRLQPEADAMRDKVKYLMCEMLEIAYANRAFERAGGGMYASQSNDGVSVTFASRDDAETNRKLCALVRRYLSGETDANGTLLLYAGVDA